MSLRQPYQLSRRSPGPPRMARPWLVMAMLLLLAPARRAAADDAQSAKDLLNTYTTVMTMAYPPAGAVFGAVTSFLEMTGYLGSARDPVGEAIKLINQRLAVLEQRMDSLERQLRDVQNELFRTQNLARTRQLRNLHRDLQSLTFALAQQPTERATKLKLANDARLIADEFINDRDLWTWSDMALKDHLWAGRAVKAGQMLEPDFKPLPTLEYYTAALSAWMAATEYASEGNTAWAKQTYAAELQRHIDFLTVRPGWDELRDPPETLPEQIKARINGQFVPSDKYPKDRVCTINETCVDAMAREIRFVQPLTYVTVSNNELCSVPEGLLGHATAREEELEGQYGTELLTLLAARLTRLKDYGTIRAQIWETTPLLPPGPGAYATFLYAVGAEGVLVWYRHEGARNGTTEWVGPRGVAEGWQQYRYVFSGGGNILYGITEDGRLDWYRHNGFNTGLPQGTVGTAALGRPATELDPRLMASAVTKAGAIGRPSDRLRDRIILPQRPTAPPAWDGPISVGTGWNQFQSVFSGSDGVIYAITTDGRLEWRRHLDYRNAAAGNQWQGPRTVGTGWGGFKTVFAMGEGVIYVVQPDGKLLWYKHNAYLDGRGLEDPQAWSGPVDVGAGWADYKLIAPAGDGIIYTVDADGTLRWRKHLHYLTGTDLAKGLPPAGVAGRGTVGDLRIRDGITARPRMSLITGWESAVVGGGWGEFRALFAMLPRRPDAVN